MEILIDEVDAGAGDRNCQQGGDHGHGCPLRVRPRKAAAGDGKTSPENQENGDNLPENGRDAEREMSYANEGGDQLVEDCCLKLQAEEIGVVREKRGVQIALDGREVKGVVFQAGMIAEDQERNCCRQE